mmetsp:Transcript_140886/g.270281  ORF Transcript_140886/g.270281 Transcript_140886/m.270281 type:complete len:358 (-) Transcript_140886:72-1145(-)
MLRPMMWAVMAAVAQAKLEQSAPPGHLEPFGSWKPGAPIEERADIPEPEDFYNEYCNSDNGHGRPLLLRGAARQMAAMAWNTDELLLEKYGNENVDQVEYNLKETRAGGNVKGMKKLKDFLNAYNSSDIYMVSQVPKLMKRDVLFLPCLRCGGYMNFLDSNMIWFGRGGSKSVVHYDDQDNINCMFVGRKRFIFMHPSYKKEFEANPNTKKNRFGWVDSELDGSVKGYGAFMGKLDVDRVDLLKYPGWQDVNWTYADLEPGDCVYIPYQWYHQVTAWPGRSINVHVWYWRPQRFNVKNCQKQEQDAKAEPVAFADCTWGYEPPQGSHPHLGVVRKHGKPPTKCKKAKPKATAPKEDL